RRRPSRSNRGRADRNAKAAGLNDRVINVDDTMNRQAGKGTQIIAIVAALAGWLVPGLGHLVLRRWSKAAVYFLCIGGLACAGLAMRGGVFGAGAEDLFARLGS